MRVFITLALAALMLVALALPAMAQTLNPTAPCLTPQVSVTCVRSPDQSTQSYTMGTAESGQVLMNCTMQVEGQALHVAFSKQPRIAGSGDGVTFSGICVRNKTAD